MSDRKMFIEAINGNKALFNTELSSESIEELADFYDIILEHNPLLHLVGPCSAEEFATRHILESLTMLQFLPKNAKFADIGSGGGLPAIPCLIVREDLRATLIESKEKKAKFLEGAVSRLELKSRAGVVNRQFEEANPGAAQYVTCRALDKFMEKLSKLVKWSGDREMLLFGGENLRHEIEAQGLPYRERLMPLSERRFLFAIATRG